MNLDCEDIFWINDCFRFYNNEFVNDNSYDKENIVVSQLPISLKI